MCVCVRKVNLTARGTNMHFCCGYTGSCCCLEGKYLLSYKRLCVNWQNAANLSRMYT